MFTKPRLIHRRGTRAAQPAANAVGVGEGTLYFVTDEGVLERSSGAAWQSFASGSSSGISGTLTTPRIPYATGVNTLGDNANLAWDNATPALDLFTTHAFLQEAVTGGFPPAAATELVVKNALADGNVLSVRNTDTAGYSTYTVRTADGHEVLAMGYGNPSAFAFFADQNYIQSWSGVSTAANPKRLVITMDGNYGAIGSGFRFYQRQSFEPAGDIKFWQLIPNGTAQKELLQLDAANSRVLIGWNNGAAPSAILHVVGGQPFFDSIGTSGLITRSSGGSVSAPTQTAALTTVFQLAGRGYTDAGAYTGNMIAINGVAVVAPTTTDQESRIDIRVTPAGTAALATVMQIFGTSVLVNTNNSLQVNGNIRAGFGLATSFQTTINIVGGISAADTTITVTSATNFPVAGVVRCQGELVTYTGKTGTTLTGCTRGRFGTTAATHANGQAILLMPIVTAESDTSTVAMIGGPGNLYIGTSGDLFDIGSSTVVSLMKIGTQFTVSGTVGVAWQDSGATGMVMMLWDGTNAVFGTRTNAPIAFRTNNTARAYITSNQNLILDAATNSDPGTGTKCLILGDGTAPASLASNTCGIYGNDVGGTVNLFGVNEAGEVTQLTGGIGYPTGQGGTVTQITNKATGVTLSKYTGEITLNNATLNAATTVSFTLTNTKIAAGDVLALAHQSGGTLGSYTLNAACAAGSAVIYVRNITAGNLGEAIVIRFVVLRGATA